MAQMINFMEKKKILAIIPARGGSKRLPRKNLLELSGKPLISYTIEAAKNSKYIDKVVVSTDNDEIAEISKQYGAEIIKRPKDIATDKAKSADAVLHTLKVLEKDYAPDIFVLLQPTSPLRTAQDIDKAIKIFLSDKHDSVISVSEVPKPVIHYSFSPGKDYLKPIFSWKYLKDFYRDRVRELNKKLYLENGAIYVIAPRSFKKYKRFTLSKTFPYVMPKNKSIDIDTKEDFWLCEKFIKEI